MIVLNVIVNFVVFVWMVFIDDFVVFVWMVDKKMWNISMILTFIFYFFFGKVHEHYVTRMRKKLQFEERKQANQIRVILLTYSGYFDFVNRGVWGKSSNLIYFKSKPKKQWSMKKEWNAIWINSSFKVKPFLKIK